MANIKFNYLYRDGSNYKNWAEVVFPNPEKLSVSFISKELGKVFDDNLFIAHQIRIPEVFDFPDHQLTSDDHCYHEFNNIEVTRDSRNDFYGRSVHQFLSEVTEASKMGWRAFQRLS